MNSRASRALLAAAIFIIGASGERGAAAANRRPSLFQGSGAASGPEVLVRFKEGCSAAERAATLRRLGLQWKRSACRGTVEVACPTSGQASARSMRMLSQDTNVAFVEPNGVAHAMQLPNDPLFAYQWHLQNTGFGVRAPAAWSKSRGAGVVVAVVDSGIAYANRAPYRQAPDLEQTRFIDGYDFVNDDPYADDDNGHGTQVAGVIAQSTNNQMGCAGIAPDALLMPVKVLDAQGAGKYDAIAEGIRFAADNGADVINLSLGGPTYSATIHEAIQYAVSKGALVLAAAGNAGSKGLAYPAELPEVIAVGAIRFDGTRSYYSNYGPNLDVVAPGGDPRVDQNKDGYEDGILQQSLGDGGVGTFRYRFLSGTSMAVAQASGVAALIRALRPEWNAAQVREALEKSAMDLGPVGRDDESGAGAVNAETAVRYVLPGQAPPALVAAAPAPLPAVPQAPPAVPTTPVSPAPATPAPAPVIQHNVAISGLRVAAGVRRDGVARAIVTLFNAGLHEERVTIRLQDSTTGVWVYTGTAGVAPGKSAELECSWNVGALVGAHTLLAVASLPAAAPDQVPGDNQKTERFEVARGLLSLTLTPSQAPFRPDGPVAFTARVRGQAGPVAGAVFRVTLYSPRGYRFYSRTSVADAQGSASVRLSRYSPRYGLGTGQAELTVTADGFEPLTYKSTFDIVP